MRSLACCSGRWKCGAKRPPLAATRATISALQSIGSSELILNVTSAGDESSARRSDTSELDGVRSRPYEPEVNAGQRDLLEARGCHARDLAEHAVDRQAAAGAARRRDDAVAAPLLASGLHAQRERRAAGDARLDRRAAGAVAVGKTLGGRLRRASPSRDSRRRGRRSGGRQLRPAGGWRNSRSRPLAPTGCRARCA